MDVSPTVMLEGEPRTVPCDDTLRSYAMLKKEDREKMFKTYKFIRETFLNEKEDESENTPT